MKLIWKSPKILKNSQGIAAGFNKFKLLQELKEWSWLEKKISNHLDNQEDLNTNEITEY